MTPANVYEHGGRRRCRECQRERTRAWQRRNPGHGRRAYHRDLSRSRERSRAKRFAHAYRMTVAEARVVLAARPSCCEVCGRAGRVCYDHDHATGEARGWLCSTCNSALGHAQDDPALLRALADYLERSGAS